MVLVQCKAMNFARTLLKYFFMLSETYVWYYIFAFLFVLAF